jgi:hypothetical protein
MSCRPVNGYRWADLGQDRYFDYTENRHDYREAMFTDHGLTPVTRLFGLLIPGAPL